MIQKATRKDLDVDVPKGRGSIALLESIRATGGTAPDEVLSRLLDERRAGNALSLVKLVQIGQVFGFEWRGSVWMPMFQFEGTDFAVKFGAQRARAALPVQWLGWTVASWFATTIAKLRGCTPADALDSNFDAVLQLAHSFSPHQAGGHAVVPGRRPPSAV